MTRRAEEKMQLYESEMHKINEIADQENAMYLF